MVHRKGSNLSSLNYKVLIEFDSNISRLESNFITKYNIIKNSWNIIKIELKNSKRELI